MHRPLRVPGGGWDADLEPVMDDKEGAFRANPVVIPYTLCCSGQLPELLSLFALPGRDTGSKVIFGMAMLGFSKSPKLSNGIPGRGGMLLHLRSCTEDEGRLLGRRSGGADAGGMLLDLLSGMSGSDCIIFSRIRSRRKAFSNGNESDIARGLRIERKVGLRNIPPL